MGAANTRMSGMGIVPPSAIPPDPVIPATAMETSTTVDDTATQTLVSLERILGYRFRDKKNLKLALTHPTSNPTKCVSQDNDRLEALGDKLLGALVMIECYAKCPTYGAGELANLTSMITCNDTFAVLAVKMGIHTHLKHKLKPSVLLALNEFVQIQNKNGHLFSHENMPSLIQSSVSGETIAVGMEYPKIAADLFEAIAASIYVDCDDFDTFRRVFLGIMRETIDNFMIKNPKCPLTLAKQRRSDLKYRTERPLPDGRICVAIKISNICFKGVGTTLKSAKTAATRFAMASFPLNEEKGSSRKRRHSKIVPSTGERKLYGKRNKRGC